MPTLLAPPLPPPARVVDRLPSDFDASGIAIQAGRDGHVVLTGAVRSWAEWDAAWRTAWAVPGVREVDNQLVLIG
jgi:osmotically-inducible protein OsmY